MYIADHDNSRVRRVSQSGLIFTFAGTGNGAPYNGENVAATAANLYNPASIQVDASNGDVYVVCDSAARIEVISGTTGTVTTFAGSNRGSDSATDANGDGGFATAATLNYPAGLYLDSSGNVYFADYGSNKIRSVTDYYSPTIAPTAAPSHVRSSVNTITTVMGTGAATSGGSGGRATAASMYQPMSVFRDTNGVVYVSEFEGNCVRKFSTSDYIVVNVAGVCGTTLGTLTTNVATSATLRFMVDVVVSTSGVVYFADCYGWAVRSVSTVGILSVFAGDAGPDSLASGVASSTGLAYPYGLWLDSVGQMYIVSNVSPGMNNPYGCLVRRVSASGYSTVFAGTVY